ncbi:hypothetical protein ACFPK1_16225 [Actinomycetospora rhizophila]|uniref:DUF4760 domain-containing protein n=1 Tax=Actinomycetospora rhizophila TaxID=1416876 RepID=A0ABV9ZDW4_9PSEU
MFGAVLGVVVTAWATRSRERGQYVWERRANIYLELMRDVRAVDNALFAYREWDLRGKRNGEENPPTIAPLTFEDPAKFEELALFCSHTVVNRLHYYLFEYKEWKKYHDDWGPKLLNDLGNGLRSEAAYDLRVKRYRRKDRAEDAREQVYVWYRRIMRFLKKPIKYYRHRQFWRHRKGD